MLPLNPVVSVRGCSSCVTTVVPFLPGTSTATISTSGSSWDSQSATPLWCRRSPLNAGRRIRLYSLQRARATSTPLHLQSPFPPLHRRSRVPPFPPRPFQIRKADSWSFPECSPADQPKAMPFVQHFGYLHLPGWRIPESPHLPHSNQRRSCVSIARGSGLQPGRLRVLAPRLRRSVLSASAPHRAGKLPSCLVSLHAMCGCSSCFGDREGLRVQQVRGPLLQNRACSQASSLSASQGSTLPWPKS
jgi:hypothetical protein